MTIRKTTLLGASVLALAALVAVVLLADGHGREGRTSAHRIPVYRMHADHLTYAGIAELRADADAIVVGTVIAKHTIPGDSPGTDEAGDPLPAVPHTEYDVRVGQVFQGTLTEGAQIVVSLSGGSTPNGKFVLDGGPSINEGNVELFFLKAGDDGKFYPLAGGAAVADKRSDGTFAIPPETTGQDGFVATEADLKGGPPPDTTAPIITALAAKPRTFAVNPKGRRETPVAAKAKRGTHFNYTLSEHAQVTFALTRAASGRRVGKKCVALTRKNRNRKKCHRSVPAGRFAVASLPGTNSHAFAGRIGSRKLGPGAYTARLTATDASNNRSIPRAVRFTIVAR